ncbi:MAG: N-acetylmuramic acid 6-phosphate etherase [Myxococcota bacterium]
MGERRSPSTEALHPQGEDLDLASIREVVFRLHQEDLAAVEAVGRVLPSVSEAAQAAADALRTGGRLIYVGAGTSGRLGVLDAAECPPTFGTQPEQVVALIAGGEKALVRAVEGAEDDERAGVWAVKELRVGKADLVVGISASSATAYVLGALAEGRRRGAKTALVCCNREAAEEVDVDIRVLPQTGAELIAGSTRLKAGTATKLVLNAISTAAMVALGKVYRGRMIDLVASNKKLAARAQRMVAELAGVTEAKAKALIDHAGGRPRLALAMHWTGLDAASAQKVLKKRTLRELERGALAKRPRQK